MVAPAGAAVTASLMVRKCVVSSCPSAYDALTKSVLPAGGNGALQSLTGTHVALPRRSRVPEPMAHAAAGSTASQPQPFAADANPGAHAVTPTGAHVVLPIAARVPGAQGAGGSIGVQPAPPKSGVNPSPHSASGATASGVSAGGAASFDEVPQAGAPTNARAATTARRMLDTPWTRTRRNVTELRAESNPAMEAG